MNNFKDYGFEADFEGHIYERDRTYLLGKVRFDYDIKLFRWNYQTGICREDEKYNLRPIKKEWHEHADSFPCLCIDSYDNPIIIFSKEEYDKCPRLRPATKEETLALLVKA